MSRWSLVLALLVTVAACESPSPSSSGVHSPAASASAGPSASVAGQPLGVFIDGNLSTYSVLLIGTDGKTAAQAKAAVPAAYRYTKSRPSPPLVSVSNSRVYFADGASIKFLNPDGSTGMARPYPCGAQGVAGFAVSP